MHDILELGGGELCALVRVDLSGHHFCRVDRCRDRGSGGRRYGGAVTHHHASFASSNGGRSTRRNHVRVAELRATVALANGEIERVDSLLDTAETVGARVEATSRLAWLVMRNPLVKLASLSVATDRSAQRLARNDTQIDAVEPLAITDGSRGKSRRSRNARNVTSRRERRAS